MKMQKQVQQRNEKMQKWGQQRRINEETEYQLIAETRKKDLKFVNGVVAETSSQTEWVRGCKNEFVTWWNIVNGGRS